jgi:glycosyltransferase involved in cell wall biosynthesis
MVGKPFAPYGRGATSLLFFRAFREVGWLVPVREVRPGGGRIDRADAGELQGHLVDHNGSRITIYHLNQDEIEPAQAELGMTLPDGSYNILYPFWELEEIPDSWVPSLEPFDEIWAPSRFIQQAFSRKLKQPVVHMPPPVEIRLPRFLGRPYFGLPEEAFLILFSFDLRSYIARKNPHGAVRAFEILTERLDGTDVRLVIKLHGEDLSGRTRDEYRQFRAFIAASPAADRIILLAGAMSDLEVKNLIRCTDCYLSLHRSEGFGLGMAEAMYLGRPVVATRYSGNLDFMTDQVAKMVDPSLIPVAAGEYPHHEGQRWADPDVVQAAAHLCDIVTDQRSALALGKRASLHMRVNFSATACGLRYVGRVEEILGERLRP